MKKFLCLFCLMAGSALADTSNWSGTSQISFNGTSTVNSWGGKVATKPFATTVTTDAAGNPTRVEATVRVEVAGMDTAEAARDVKMRESMQATAYPLITGVIDTPFSAISQGSATPSTLPLKLTLLGKTQTVMGRISHWKLQGNRATFDLDFDLSLKQSGIKVPSMLLVIRVGDTIKVHAAVSLKRNAS
jgi:polyisoprenoid-binding protein YceI